MIKRLKKLWYRTKISYYEQMMEFKKRQYKTRQITLEEHHISRIHNLTKIASLTDKLQKL